MDPSQQFKKDVAENIVALGDDSDVKGFHVFGREKRIATTTPTTLTWQGRPVIQYPQDLMAMQELIWSIQPDLIIETGIAHGAR